MTGSRRSWGRVAGRTAVVGLSIALALAAGVKYVLAPWMIKAAVQRAVGRCWAGQVNIGQVAFDYLGPVRLRNVDLLDGQGRSHLRAGSVTLTVSGLAGPSPRITQVFAHDCRLCLHLAEGRLVLPADLREARRLLQQQGGLESLRIRKACLAVEDDGKAGPAFQAERIDWLRQEGWYATSIETPPSAGWAPAYLSATAQVRGGRLLALASVRTDREPIVDSLAMTVGRQQGDGTRVEFKSDVLDGRMAGALCVTTVDAQPAYRGWLRAEHVDLDALARAFPEHRGLATGEMTAHIVLSGTLAADDLRCSGQLEIQDVDPHRGLLTERLFAMLNGGLGGETRSNIQADFILAGSVATIRRATLADSLRVMKVQEGGTIDLATKAIDLYLLTLEVPGIGGLLDRVPVVGLATSLANKLTRIHVTGTWDDQVFSKEPVEDVSAAAVEVLGQAFAAGAKLPFGPRSPLEDLLGVLTDAGMLAPTTSTAPAGDDR